MAMVGCSPTRYLARELPQEPLDAVFVPGCPSRMDGALSPCQLGRAAWGAWLYRQGAARYLIPSGGAVYSPFVEADAMAQAMALLGVPPERIILEREALHTDENMWNSLRIARRMGWSRIGVASNEGHALWACRMLEDWAQPCAAFALDAAILADFLPAYEPMLQALRGVAMTPWRDVDAQEEARAKRVGRSRPPSYMLYPAIGPLRFFGYPWVPIGGEASATISWADVLAGRDLTAG